MKTSILTFLICLTSAFSFCQTSDFKKLDSLFHILEENNKFMGSVAISQDGKLLYARSVGYSDIENSKKADINTKYRIGSISKIFTATLILKAIEENKISLDQSIDKYFPEIENSNKINIGNLLNHKSGIHDFTNDKIYSDYNTKFKSEKQLIEIIAKAKSDFEPGSKIEYSNSNYILLSYVLEKIYNNSYAALLNARISKPLRLTNTYYGSNINAQKNESYSYHFKKEWIKGTETDLSIPLGAGGVVSNPVDLTAFIEQLFTGKIISHKSLAIMTTLEAYHGLGMGNGLLSSTHFEKKSYGHNGAIDDFTSLLDYFPEDKLSVAITSNGLRYPVDKIQLYALSSWFNKPYVIPTFNHVEVLPAVLNLYSGMYQSKQLPLIIDITIKENELFGQVKGQLPFPLEATAQNAFRFEKAGIVLEFDASKKQMVLIQNGQKFLFTRE